MAKITYIEAVDQTEKVFKELILRGENTASDYDVFFETPPLLQARAVAMFGNWGQLIERAESDFTLFIGLQKHIAEHLEEKKNLPQIAQQWLIKFLKNEIPKPKKKGGRKPTPDYLTVAIYTQTEALIAFGYKKTRGENSKKMSAFDIIAEAMTKLKQTPNDYGAVRKAYKRGREAIQAQM